MATLQRRFLVKTLFGLESVLADEIRSLGGSQVEEHNRAVSTVGDMDLCYSLNYQCRTALAVLMPLHEGTVPDEQALYDLVKQVPWWEYFSLDKTFIIDVVSYADQFTNSHFLALKCKDAIVDQFREKYNRRPSISKGADIKINVFIKGDHCIISLDTSGDSLFKRGYRLQTGRAPINEVLAAGLIYLSGWDQKTPLVDPMCGSGTIIMEAALMSSRVAPQKGRDHFSFMHLNSFERDRWMQIREKAHDAELSNTPSLIGRDLDRHTLNLAKSNAANAMITSIKWEKGDFFNYRPQSKNGVMIFNPPYDERMPLQDAITFYKQIGDVLKTHFTGWEAWIISSHLQAVKRVGLKPSRRIPLFNGPLECRFVHFEMYEGTRAK
ncbi:MAG: class I SAM-dependent RNA methyltransferase [Saprospiraceae bacterium]|nr:class I SAM-dependent RNA methyltransferase [Saprospiraceae bacterium]